MLMQVIISLGAKPATPSASLKDSICSRPKTGVIRKNIAASICAIVLIILATLAVLYPK